MESDLSRTKPNGDPQDLVRLAEWEIKRLEDAKKDQGWSPWMLYVALAGLLWTLVDQLNPSHIWAHVALYWAAFTLLANFLSDLLRLLMARPREKAAAAPRFFSANKFLGGTRPHLLFVAVKVTTAAMLVLFSHALAGFPKTVWALLFGFHFLGWLLVLTLSFFDMPLPVSADRSHVAVRGSVGVAYVLNVAAMFFMCRELWPILTQPFSAPDLKLALLFFAGSEIVSLLLSHHIVNPIRDNLIQFRRALSLGEITYENAKPRLDLILHGAEISKYLQPRVQTFLSILNDVTREQDAVTQCIAAATEKISATPTAAGVEALRVITDKTTGHVKAVTRLLKQAEHAIDAFNLRVAAVTTSDDRIEEEIRPLRESMRQQVTAATENSVRNEKSFSQLGQEIESFKQRAGDSHPPAT